MTKPLLRLRLTLGIAGCKQKALADDEDAERKRRQGEMDVSSAETFKVNRSQNVDIDASVTNVILKPSRGMMFPNRCRCRSQRSGDSMGTGGSCAQCWK